MTPIQGYRKFLIVSLFALRSLIFNVPCPLSLLYAEPVSLGIDVLQEQGFDILSGKKVGLIANHTSKNKKGESTALVLARAPNLKLAALFTPEHGYTGWAEGGAVIESSTDPLTGLPIHSLYGKTLRPSPETLQGLDVLVFDIQDVGSRFYTYLTTMGYCLEEAAKAGIEFVVLDRPNPITGTIVEGHVLDSSIRHFTAYFPVPARHGMTAGEIARLHNETLSQKARLTVIPMKGWQRKMWFDQTGLPWTATSPNIPKLENALLYSGLGCFESTNLAVGRGTELPFLWAGAPWMDSKAVLKRLKKIKALKGAKFSRKTLIPSKELYQGKKCEGIEIGITDREALRPTAFFVHLAFILGDLHPEDFKIRWDEIRRMTGTDRFKDYYISGEPAEKALEVFDQSTEEFLKTRQSYLLYP